MAKKEFNLSVLENVTAFDTPLKECFDYESLLSLIKEEIDIDPTEDESEYQKIDKYSSPLRGTKRKCSDTCENVFKSPYKKKYCLKLKSPGSLSTTAGKDQKPLGADFNNARQNRGRTLGALKPRRSSIAKKRQYRSSVCHSETSAYSDFEDENVTQRRKKALKNGYIEPIVQQNGIEYKDVLSITERTVDSSNADDEISISSKDESTSLATTDPLGFETANDNYVESSQSTETSSELRQRINQRRNTMDLKTPLSVVVKQHSPNDRVKSEDEDFTLTLTPSSKSSSTTIKKEASESPVQAINRKSICRESPLKNGMQDHDEDSYGKSALGRSSLRERRRKISVASPLKGLTQELENCIRNGNYVEMCDSETETMSFTFETIQLLNDYEDCNQKANNKIFDKILSSPTTTAAEEDNSAIADNLITPKKEQFIEDPLHIDYTNNNDPSLSTSKKKKSTKKNSTAMKNVPDQVDEEEDPLHIDTASGAINHVAPLSALENRSFGDEKRSCKSEMHEESLHIDDDNNVNNVPSTSTAKMWLNRESEKESGESELDEVGSDREGSGKAIAKNRPEGRTKESCKSQVDEKSSCKDDTDTIEDDSPKSTDKKPKEMPKRNLPVRKCREREVNDNSLYLDDSDTTGDVSSESSIKEEKERTENKTKAAKRESASVEKTRKREKNECRDLETSQDSMKGLNGVKSEPELDKKSLHTDDSYTIEGASSMSPEKKPKKPERDRTGDSDSTGDFSSTSSAEEGKKTAKAKRKSRVRRIRKKEKEEFSGVENSETSEFTGESDTEADDLLATSESEMMSDSDEKSTPLAKSIKHERRSIESSKNKEPVNMNLSDSETEERLARKAAKLAKKIAAAKKKNAVPENVYQEMIDLSVKLRHVPPPQHNIKEGLSVRSRGREERVFRKYGSIKKGPYSSAEDEIIKKNWHDFCQDHDWDPDNYKPFLSLKHGTKYIMSSSDERKKFVQFLANGLPNRPLLSVYKRFKLLLDKRYILCKRYEAKEDANIIAYTTYHSPQSKVGKFADLSQIMDRSTYSIWKRNQTLRDKANKVGTTLARRVVWDLPLVEKFIRLLLDITISDDLIDLKDAYLPRVVWYKMEQKMEIQWDLLQRFWEQRLHVQLFAPEPILINEIKIKLIECLYRENVNNYRDIRWGDLVKYFDGYTTSSLRYVFHMLILKLSTQLKARGLRAMLEFLHSEKIRYLVRKPNDKCLPRISYKNKKAAIIVED